MEVCGKWRWLGTWRVPYHPLLDLHGTAARRVVAQPIHPSLIQLTIRLSIQLPIRFPIRLPTRLLLTLIIPPPATYHVPHDMPHTAPHRIPLPTPYPCPQAEREMLAELRAEILEEAVDETGLDAEDLEDQIREEVRHTRSMCEGRSLRVTLRFH